VNGARPAWRSVLHIHARPGRIKELTTLFETEPIFAAALETGCRGAELLVAADEVVVLAAWDELSDYQAWLESPRRAGWAPAISNLADSQHGDIYRLVLPPDSPADDQLGI
jgi:heme-degrading monooxygenase HmoA